MVAAAMTLAVASIVVAVGAPMAVVVSAALINGARSDYDQD
jgi:hypothetical protein